MRNGKRKVAVRIGAMMIMSMLLLGNLQIALAQDVQVTKKEYEVYFAG